MLDRGLSLVRSPNPSSRRELAAQSTDHYLRNSRKLADATVPASACRDADQTTPLLC
jgi:hypothetical protein